MHRPVLDDAHIHNAIREKVANYNADIVREVQAAIASNAVVVVGMTQNPFPKRARKALDAARIPYKYLGYGSYTGGWRRRFALKMWTGWPTLPMVFVHGVLVGGASDLSRLVESGELGRMLSRESASTTRDPPTTNGRSG
jgi:monothiol glutaredoxin